MSERWFGATDIDTASSAALALRALQKLDELEAIENRHLLIEAETHLGDELGIDCAGRHYVESGIVRYEHNGPTCPVHEWLVEDDQRNLQRTVQREGHEQAADRPQPAGGLRDQLVLQPLGPDPAGA